MNKDSLTQAVAEATKMTRKTASLAIDAIFGAITQSLKAGDPVILVGFGSFKAKKRSARVGRNPRTGEAISIPAAIVPSFSPGKSLKEAVNQKK
jgi:DNA-binding protein HU-beta